MKPKLSHNVVASIAITLLIFSCKKQPGEFLAPASEADSGSGNIAFTNAAALQPDPNIVYYVGDLSVSITNTGRTKYDSCARLVNVYYDVTVKNLNGNSKFSFDVEFSNNDVFTKFYYPDGTTKDNGRARIETLQINETRTISGYIQAPSVTPLVDVANTFTLKGAIKELQVQPIGGIIYKIKTDTTPRNNISSLQIRLPYFTFTKTVFDDLAIATLPSSGTMYGYQAINPFGSGVPNYAPFALSAAYPTVNLALVGWGLSQMSIVQFEKVGCLPVSGKPFYYLKSRGKYLTYWLGSGVVLTDPAPGSETARRWVLVSAPHVDNTPGASYYIYNMALGKNFRLQVRSLIDPQVNDTPVNFIGIGAPDATNKQQVFVAR